MASCILCCSSSGSDDGTHEGSSEYFDEPAAALQERIQDEIHPPQSFSPLQRPTKELMTVARPEGPSTGPVLKEGMIHIDSLYDISRHLGSGRYSVIFKCTDHQSGEPFACKRIKKDQPEFATRRVRNEIKILHHLSGLPHIVKFERAYEDEDYVYLIMELCEGGELYQRIYDLGRLPEQQALKVFRQIIEAVHYCHLMGVMHRDIKPENIVLVDRSEEHKVRLVDFGLSRFFVEGKRYRHRSGTVDYAAPEVLQRSFGKEADVWSAGIVLYILLCGGHPFRRSEESPLLQEAIKGGKFDIKDEPWPSISESAKDLVRKMLNTNPKHRITTAQIFEHPWVKDKSVPLPVRLPPIFEFFSKLRRIREMTLIRRIGLMIMVKQLSEIFIKYYKQVFTSIGTGEGGLISYEDFCKKVFVMGLRVTELELDKLIDQDEVSGGTADFMELMVAVAPSDFYENDRILTSVFKKFRLAGSRYIDKECLEFVLMEYFGGQPSEELLKEAFEEVGINPNGKINITRFRNIMKGTGEESLMDWIVDMVLGY